MVVRELLIVVTAVVIGGLLSGLLAGLFGVGGGAILVPLLFEIFGILNVSEQVRIQLSVGTSLAIILPTSIRSFQSHKARGILPLEILRIWALPVLAGAAAGGAIAAIASAAVFKIAFIVMATLIAAKLLWGRDGWRISDTLPRRRPMIAYGFAIGLWSALTGVGGGALSTILMTLHGASMHVAVGISAGVGVFISTAGAMAYIIAGLPHQSVLPPLSIGYVSVLAVLLIAPLSALAAPFGARVAHGLSKRKLEIWFGIFLLVVALRFLVSLTVDSNY